MPPIPEELHIQSLAELLPLIKGCLLHLCARMLPKNKKAQFSCCLKLAYKKVTSLSEPAVVVEDSKQLVNSTAVKNIQPSEQYCDKHKEGII